MPTQYDPILLPTTGLFKEHLLQLYCYAHFAPVQSDPVLALLSTTMDVARSDHFTKHFLHQYSN